MLTVARVEVRATVPSESAPPDLAPHHHGEWQDIRCHHCRRLLMRAKNPTKTVRPGELIQIKCSCNRMNYVVGSPDE